jgi:hypothetical protein
MQSALQKTLPYFIQTRMVRCAHVLLRIQDLMHLLLATASCATSDLEGNYVSQAGPLPAEWSTLASLQVLRIASNGGDFRAFSSLPPTWSQLSQLKQLAISNATFSSSGLPASWSNMTVLQSLTLRNVSFAAAGQLLPASWGGLSSLQTLEFEQVSGLTGPLPAAWQLGLPALQQLHLSSVPGLNASLADYLVLVNQVFRLAGANGTSELVSLKLNELGLIGSIPAAMFNNMG